MERALTYNKDKLLYRGIIGTGGIGSGKFFVLNGNETLGREESRSGRFLNVNDYCKQHIILHYIKVLLGTDFQVIPAGRVGDDDTGNILYDEMEDTGFVMDLVDKMPGVSTLFSFCFYYPDGTGGNLTTDNSASSMVDPLYIEKASGIITGLGSAGIIVAAPEVPVESRIKLLELGKQNGLFCSASFTSEEIRGVVDSGLMKKVDYIAINIDEASALADGNTDKTNNREVVLAAIQKLQMSNKGIMVSVTAGKHGSWCWDGKNLNFLKSIVTKAVSTAGAGDAFFSGMLTGLALGLNVFEAQQLATLIAGLSVTSPDTIHKGIDRQSLKKFIKTSDIKFSETITKLLEDK